MSQIFILLTILIYFFCSGIVFSTVNMELLRRKTTRRTSKKHTSKKHTLKCEYIDIDMYSIVWPLWNVFEIAALFCVTEKMRFVSSSSSSSKKRKICIVQRLVASNHPGGKLRIRTAEVAKRNAREYIRVFDLFAWHFEFVGWECSISHNSTTEKLFSILLNWESIESWEREKQGPFFCVSLVTCSAIDMLVYN